MKTIYDIETKAGRKILTEGEGRITKHFDGNTFIYQTADQIRKAKKEFSFALLYEVNGKWYIEKLSNSTAGFEAYTRNWWHSHWDIANIESI